MTDLDLTTMNIVQVPVGDLFHSEYNPRKWTDKARADLKTSLRKYGITQPLVVNKNPNRKNIIIGGHFKHDIAIELGLETVPVLYVDLDAENERELNLRMNKNQGEFDNNMLAEFFDEDLLKSVGFDEQELDKIYPDLGDEDDFDTDAEIDAIEEPDTQPGDIWELGKHRLMCGDATNLADVDALMDGHSADVIFTDPPYNVNYSGRGKKTSNTIKNDHMAEEAFRDFLNKTFQSYHHLAKEDAPMYCCYASSTHREFEDAINASGYKVINQIIWVKTVASMGWGDYRWKHEPLLYCKIPGKNADFFGDRKQYTVWEEQLSDAELLATVKKLVVKDENGGSTVWRLGRDQNYDHPTQKPLKLIKIALRNSSKRGDLVVDLFGGSGSTMISADKNNRQAFLMELDPKYCDVIRKRWEQHSDGMTPKLIYRREQETDNA